MKFEEKQSPSEWVKYFDKLIVKIKQIKKSHKLMYTRFKKIVYLIIQDV